jgi:hypothetical protein
LVAVVVRGSHSGVYAASHSYPSEAEVQQRLCACIWENLKGLEKDTARALAEKRTGEVSALNMRAFSSRFGSRLKECGGMEL